MTEWEYAKKYIHQEVFGKKINQDIMEILNQLGQEGWEVISMEYLGVGLGGPTHEVFLKRKIGQDNTNYQPQISGKTSGTRNALNPRLIKSSIL